MSTKTPAVPALPPPAAYRVEWREGDEQKWTSWHQYHDDYDPMPARWDDEPPHRTIALYTAEQMRAAILAEQERCATLISSGDYCRYVDHAQGCCDCVEMASAIRNSGGELSKGTE